MRTIAIACALLAFAMLATDATGARVGKRQLWGSIVYDSKSRVFGYAVDLKTKREAETEAFRQCGDCDVIKTFRDSCGAIADTPRKFGDKPKKAGFVWETGASQEIAERKALRKCGADCKIVVWACTAEK
ncbi:MAG TPA: DUF4189 domain-containing protein [Burkholderiales bacterium]|nr:DUF4189 domain-containing protein [Burkholderiales bacterium]